jgi:hypothetical protein
MDINIIKESIFLLPDSIIYGSFLFGVITLSIQHSLFFISILESLVFLFGFQYLSGFLFGKSLENITCKPSLFKYTFENIFMTPSANIPSYGMYIVSFASTYLAMSLTNIKQELDVLDTSYIKQYNYGFICLALLAVTYALLRTFLKCDSAGSIGLALVFGCVTGIAIVYQNTHLFGRNSVNFMGIPLLRSKTADGQPIYICS